MESCNVFKQRYNLKKMATAGEDEGCERENAAKLEWAGERLHGDGVQRMYGTWLNPEAFGEVYLVQAWTKRDDSDEKGRKAGQAEAHVGFFVNAASVKEDPFVIGKYAKPSAGEIEWKAEEKKAEHTVVDG